MTAPPAYTVRVVTPPAGAGVLGLTFATNSSSFSRPPTFALGRNGSAAVILGGLPGLYSGTSVLIVRNDGSRTVLAFPPGGTDNSCVAPGPNVDRRVRVHLDTVAVAGDGTPFISVSCINDGAYLSIVRTTALWNGDGWHANGGDIVPLNPVNRSVAAADTLTHVAYNGDYGYTFANLDEAQHTPHYQEEEAGYTQAGRGFSLGYGSATAMRAQFVAGYSAGVNGTTTGLTSTVALEWTNGRRSILGPGVAYGVDDRGVVVGDDETEYGGSDGHPTMWSRGKATRLSPSHGSAYAIGDDGTVVGALERGGFVIRGSDAARRVRYLDESIAPHTWHIAGAYGVAANGRILAVGNKPSGAPELLLLDPVTR